MFLRYLKKIFFSSPVDDTAPCLYFTPEWSKFLLDTVFFYRNLSPDDRSLFERRVLLFLETTSIESGQVTVTDEDRLLVASSAIIPVWSFPDWHYINLKAVYLLPGAFNDTFETGQADSRITGMVGTGPMVGKMALSKPDLHLGFKNHLDKQNVGIHEFVHLIDMMDGECEGYPERLREFKYSIPWFDLVEKKTHEILKGKSNIRDYGAYNNAEFLSVTSEYFFERPAMLKKKHPELYAALTELYQQDVADIKTDIKIRKKDPCPCGSGKRYKRCCLINTA
ncbi:Inner membrane protein [hydrothermal vent metagenome]|uniref:Inner membrane protein n=1 Tax=hydrothermal vent metagenome TaxID=652676 RepID=A0A3B0XST0_9ZZZZ